MPRVRFAPLGLALVLGVAGCNRVEGRPNAAPERPNLLLVTIDTLRADHVGAYGAEDAQTPTLDGLAREGTRFTTAVASAPLTLPSHASMLTGIHPPGLGVRHNGLYRLDGDFETLAERLRAEGWATAAVIGAFVLHRSTGLDQGFDLYDDETSPEAATPSGFLERRAEAVTERALAWLETAPRPFFLWVHYYDPHARYQPPPPFAERFAARPYDGEIAYVDAQLGRLLAGMRGAGALANTLVVATSDHGESLGEHDEIDHGYALYDSVLSVPFLMRGPGVPVGRVVEDVVSGVDVTPTALDLLGLPSPPDLDGRSLRALWSGKATSPRLAYAETLATQLDLGWAPLFAVRGRRFLYVRAPRPELYDTPADPGQLRNLLEDPDEAARRQAELLDAEVAAVLARAKGAVPKSLDAESLARLRALGYALPERAPTHLEPDPDALDPKDGRRQLGLLASAQDAYDADQMDRARELLERVLRAMPRSSRAHALLAFVQLHEGHPRQALPHLEAAVRHNPLAAYYRAMLGETRRQLGDADGALRDFQAAAALDPDEPHARVGLMADALRRGDVAAAEQHARRAIARSPADAEVRVRVGDTWAAAREHVRAGAAFEAAVRLDPGSAYAQMRLAIELARFGRVEASARHRARAGALARDPWLETRLALAHAASGDPDRAEAVLHAILEREPGYEPAERALARIARRRRELGGAASPGPS